MPSNVTSWARSASSSTNSPTRRENPTGRRERPRTLDRDFILANDLGLLPRGTDRLRRPAPRGTESRGDALGNLRMMLSLLVLTERAWSGTGKSLAAILDPRCA